MVDILEIIGFALGNPFNDVAFIYLLMLMDPGDLVQDVQAVDVVGL